MSQLLVATAAVLLPLWALEVAAFCLSYWATSRGRARTLETAKPLSPDSRGPIS